MTCNSDSSELVLFTCLDLLNLAIRPVFVSFNQNQSKSVDLHELTVDIKSRDKGFSPRRWGHAEAISEDIWMSTGGRTRS